MAAAGSISAAVGLLYTIWMFRECFDASRRSHIYIKPTITTTFQRCETSVRYASHLSHQPLEGYFVQRWHCPTFLCLKFELLSDHARSSIELQVKGTSVVLPYTIRIGRRAMMPLRSPVVVLQALRSPPIHDHPNHLLPSRQMKRRAYFLAERIPQRSM